MQNAFKGDYKQVASGFEYDLWGKHNPTEYLCDYDVFGARTCGYEVKFENEWSKWFDQIQDPTYKKTVDQQNAAWLFSEFAISHKLTASGANTGVCMHSNKFGTVCLLRDSGDTNMDTYRLSRAEWAAIVGVGNTEADIATSITTTYAMRKANVAAGSVDWMEAYHCDKLSTGQYVCSAFQPQWWTGKRQERYPRFGPHEANDGELSFTLLTGASSAASTYGWNKMVDGSLTLAAGAAVAAATMLLNF